MFVCLSMSARLAYLLYWWKTIFKLNIVYLFILSCSSCCLNALIHITVIDKQKHSYTCMCMSSIENNFLSSISSVSFVTYRIAFISSSCMVGGKYCLIKNHLPDGAWDHFCFGLLFIFVPNKNTKNLQNQIMSHAIFRRKVFIWTVDIWIWKKQNCIIIIHGICMYKHNIPHKTFVL